MPQAGLSRLDVHSGQVEPGGIALGHQTVGVGDEIVTTHNDRRLITTTGAWVRNGDRWTVEQRTEGGAMQLKSLEGRGTVTIPGEYVQEHVGLAYAVTVPLSAYEPAIWDVVARGMGTDVRGHLPGQFVHLASG